MLPIINRKYPVLEIHEIDHGTEQANLRIQSDHWTINVHPIFVNEVLFPLSLQRLLVYH
jgi:hypothetical protein